jgi:hypothetical protein
MIFSSLVSSIPEVFIEAVLQPHMDGKPYVRG